MSIADLRREYSRPGLDERDFAPDPLSQFRIWFDEAAAAGVVEPNAMTLATADEQGRPSARTVLLKGLDGTGFVFFSNHDSRKGRELRANPYAALVFLWLAMERQVCVTGQIEQVTREETEAYFRSRPLGSRLGAWASKQSEVVASREVIEQQLEAVKVRFDDGHVPAPPFWGGYRVIPETVEFWQGRQSRLHDRLRYRREGSAFVLERLSP